MVVGIVGLGYVGSPLAPAFPEADRRILAVDTDPGKVEAIEAGRSYVRTRRRAPGRRGGGRRGRPPARPARRARVDDVSRDDPRAARPDPRARGPRRGEDFALAYSPERVDPGSRDWNLRNTPKVLGGLTSACADRAEQLYGEVCDHLVRVSTPDAAELTKLLENIFRSVNIALGNELSLLCERMGIDVWEVVDAAATKPCGFMRFEPGPGMGGHCLPVEPFYLAWRARDFDLPTESIELAGKVNQQMPYHCVGRIERAFNGAGRRSTGRGWRCSASRTSPGWGTSAKRRR